MIFTETTLAGAFLLDLERHEDERGFFARSWCVREFAERGLNAQLVQCNISFNRHRGTLRGLHYQVSPHEEAKVVRVTQGAMHDVIIDLRPDSPTYRQWLSFELTSASRKSLYIPAGFAHGFQTLTDNVEILYLMSEFYVPDSARGVRWNDPVFGIDWPATEQRVISERDRAYPDFVT